MSSAADPVAEFLAAHEAGDLVALGTSGTAGAPRSVIRSTASWVDSFPAVAALTGLTPSARVWVPGPLDATMNLFAAVYARHLGASAQTSPQGATHAFLTPSALRACLAEQVSLAGTHVVVAGDRLSAGLRDRAADAGAVVHHYYGAAELSFVAWGTHADDLAPFPGVDVAVRGGEIWVRSPYVCTGYDGPPGPLRTDDGWATVGDRGTYDGRLLVVTGRPDAVTTGGATVHVADVEDVLRDGIAGEVVVVGLPHERLGSVVAVVLTNADDHQGALARARRQLDGAKRPRLWFHVTALPVTPAGKVDRDALASLLSGSGDGVQRLV